MFQSQLWIIEKSGARSKPCMLGLQWRTVINSQRGSFPLQEGAARTVCPTVRAIQTVCNYSTHLAVMSSHFISRAPSGSHEGVSTHLLSGYRAAHWMEIALRLLSLGFHAEMIWVQGAFELNLNGNRLPSCWCQGRSGTQGVCGGWWSSQWGVSGLHPWIDSHTQQRLYEAEKAYTPRSHHPFHSANLALALGARGLSWPD